MRDLTDRVAVITGASRGIGLAIAERLAGEGAALVLVGRSAKALARAQKRIPAKAAVVAADVTNPGDVSRLFRRVKKLHGRVDVLINCAGFFTYKPFHKTTFKDWRGNIETNLTALFLTTQGSLPLLACSAHPHVVNILSVSSTRAFPNCSAYTASKFGALGLTRVLRKELRAEGIRVTAIIPGLTDTRMLKEFGFEIPHGKVMQPEDVAEAVVGALKQPDRTTVEEILLMPASGAV